LLGSDVGEPQIAESRELELPTTIDRRAPELVVELDVAVVPEKSLVDGDWVDSAPTGTIWQCGAGNNNQRWYIQ
jgi:hypothetical protein